MIKSNHTANTLFSPTDIDRATNRSACRLGFVGAGGFANFAAKAFLSLPGTKIVAVTDINENACRKLAASLNAPAYNNYDDLLKDESVDLVYIATPPYLHYEQSKKALLCGRHVICEKPAALKSSEAEELRSLAVDGNLLYVVNLMQRYNPLYIAVKKIIDQKILGNFLHGFFENYASDENLTRDHWFWDHEKSGGIFIEHGVHFFDMFSGWFGAGKLLNAIQIPRAGNGDKLFDRVQATVSYDHAIVNFYHGFDQPAILDRQQMKLQFEKGEITLFEWVPVKLKLHALLLNEDLEILSEMFPGSTVHHHTTYPGRKNVSGRFNEIVYDHHLTMNFGDTAEKQDRYKYILTEMLHDQLAWTMNREHKRIIDADNAVESLKIAEQASAMARFNFKNA